MIQLAEQGRSSERTVCVRVLSRPLRRWMHEHCLMSHALGRTRQPVRAQRLAGRYL